MHPRDQLAVVISTAVLAACAERTLPRGQKNTRVWNRKSTTRTREKTPGDSSAEGARAVARPRCSRPQSCGGPGRATGKHVRMRGREPRPGDQTRRP